MASSASLDERNKSMTDIAAQAVREVEAEQAAAAASTWGAGADTVRAHRQPGWEDGSESNGGHRDQAQARRRLSHVEIDALKKAAADESGTDHDEDTAGMSAPQPPGRASFAPPPPPYARLCDERSLFYTMMAPFL